MCVSPLSQHLAQKSILSFATPLQSLYDLVRQSKPSRREHHWWSCRINRLLFADDLVLLASSEQGFQHAFDRLAAVWYQMGITISTKIPRYCVSPENQASARCNEAATHCSRSRRSNNLGHKLFTITESGENGTPIGKANTDLRELYRSVATKRQSCNTAKLSILKKFLNLRKKKHLHRWSWNLGGDWKYACYPKRKQQRWNFCDDFTAWHFTTKSEAVKFEKPWLSRRFFWTEHRLPTVFGVGIPFTKIKWRSHPSFLKKCRNHKNSLIWQYLRVLFATRNTDLLTTQQKSLNSTV